LYFKAEQRAKESTDLRDKTIQSLREQVLGLERERAQLQQSTSDSREAYAKLKGEFKATVIALNRAQVWIDPSSTVGGVGYELDEREPTGVFYVEAHHRRRYFMGDQAENELRERGRQRSLNPVADQREQERIDALSQKYLGPTTPPPSR
jgi:hypothetical protein